MDLTNREKEQSLQNDKYDMALDVSRACHAALRKSLCVETLASRS